jgi:hypothetical protein
MKASSRVFILGFMIVGAALVSATAKDDVKPSGRPGDPMLERALEGKASLMFVEHVTSKTDGGDLVITSARDVDGKPQTIRMRSGYTRIFRADASRDEFTREGGWYWRSGDVEGRAKGERGGGLVNLPEGMGPLIRVVYQNDDTVHWYLLGYDFRC